MQRSLSHHIAQKSSLGNSQNVQRVGDDPLRTAKSLQSLQRVSTRRSQPSIKNKDRHQSQRRVMAYYGYALAVFNVYGIPLSFGPYLEYYYNTRFSQTPFFALTAIIACQVTCIFCMGALARWLYNVSALGTMLLAGLLASMCFVVCPRFSKSAHWWLVLLFRGLFMGCILGAIRGVSLLCLASHYRNNTPLVSMQSGLAALAGAVSYTAIACFGLRNDQYQGVELANFGLSFTTLGPAALLLRKSKLCSELFATTNESERSNHKPGDEYFHIGYLLLFPGLFLLPVFSVILISNRPSNLFPEFGAYVLFATFGTGMLSSMYAGSALARRKLGPLNMFVAASCLAGCCTLGPAWAPYFYISLAWSCAYGVMLGCILTLHFKVITLFHASGVSFHANMIRNFQAMSVMAGLWAGIGIFATGLFADLVGGFGAPLTVSGTLMVAGGALMGVGRWRRTRAKNVAV